MAVPLNVIPPGLTAQQQDFGDPWITHPEFRIGEGATGAGPAAFGIAISVRTIGDTLLLVTEPTDFRATIWTPDGRLVAQVGGPGEGPGEFSGSMFVHVHREGFHIRDSRRFTSFSNAGELLGSTPFPPRSLDLGGYGLGPQALLENGSVLAIPEVSPASLLGLWGDPPIRMLPVLRLASVDGRWRMDTIAMLDQRNRAFVVAPEGVPRQGGIQSAQVFGDHDLTWFDPVSASVVVARRNVGGGDVELLEIEADGDTAWHRRIELQPVSLTREQVDKMIDDWTRTLSNHMQQIPLAAMRDAVREASYIPDPLPGTMRIHGTASGEVWFRARANQDTLAVWFAVHRESGGSEVRKVLLPTGIRVMDANETHVWGIRRDELGVEYVVGRRLVPPAAPDRP